MRAGIACSLVKYNVSSIQGNTSVQRFRPSDNRKGMSDRRVTMAMLERQPLKR